MRCVNYDWVEVFCYEPDILDPAFFEAQGLRVKVRAYGTPIYRQMFSILDALSGRPLYEIRRDPYSIKSEGGIFKRGACHLRLANETCYSEKPVEDFLQFLNTWHYKLVSTSRLDIAYDFNNFDVAIKPRDFLIDYFAGKFAKVNQSRFSAHGIDNFDNKTFHSVKWGSDASRITTKMYCKTLEMMQNDKPYIRRAWQACGLDVREVWRIEFSMKSQCKSMVAEDSGELLDLSLYKQCNRDEITRTFAALAERYLDFRKRVGDTRKDRCPRVNLLDFAVIESAYKFVDFPQKKLLGKRERMMLQYLREIKQEWKEPNIIWAVEALEDVFVERFIDAKKRNATSPR